MNLNNPFRSKTAQLKAEGSSVGEILLYGGIGEWVWEEGRGWYQQHTAMDIRTRLQELSGTCSVIHLRINSPGGYVDEGIAIINAIIQCPVPVIIYIDGIAASMAAVIALSGARVNCASNALFMFHNCSGFAYGNAQDLRESADEWDAFDGAMASTIVERSGLSAEEVSSKFLNYKDNWFTAEEAKALGLVDEVIGLESEGIPNDPTAMTHSQLAAWFRGHEAAPSPAAKKRKAVAFKPFSKSQPTNSDPMNLKALKAALEDGTIKLSDEAKKEILAEAGGFEKQISDLTAERDSAIQERDTAITARQTAEEDRDTQLKDVRTALGAEEGADLVDTAKALREKADKPGASATTEAPAAPEVTESPEGEDALAKSEQEATSKLKSMGF